MSDLIERQAAIDYLLINMADLIYGVPSAQPDRERGKWVKISPANIFECSKCGKNVMTNDISEYNFCHGCGADMRGESREDEMR